ncbi:MAG: helix-turn-helix domain-containing protein [Mogibacterium sp.]|nr:helix-turn-helix domain-containing protein [Mogibacterium sp.]
MNHNDKIYFHIDQVARMIGVTPVTIRNWEKKGLIKISRSPSNYRVFTPDDIETLKKIKTYSIDGRMSAQAIRMLLPAAGDNVVDVEDYVEKQKETFYSRKLISEKWREIRKQKGYTLEEVSQAVGISAAHLSNLENGGNVSLDLLNKLAHFYGENPLYFLEPSGTDTHLVRKGRGEAIQLKNDPGLEMHSLVSMREHVMYPVLCTVQPGCGNLTSHRHNGEEMVYILSGTFEFILNDNEVYTLRAGDTFYYKGSEMHSWKNVSGRPAKLLWVHSSLSIG